MKKGKVHDFTQNMSFILKSGSPRKISSFGILQRKISTILALVVAFIHLYLVIYVFPDPILLRGFHAAVFVAFAIYWYSPNKDSDKKVSFFDFIIITSSLLTLIYLIINSERFIMRWDFFDPIYTSDLFFGTVFILILFEAVRRVLGWPMCLVSIFFFLYSIFGHYIPGLFIHKEISFSRIIEIQFLTTLGMFGFVTGVSATFVFMFILFGSVMRYSGGADFFFSIGRIFGGVARGGAAKTAVISSAFFSMISGSANANVATTGSFTIPAMKRLGYPPEFAAAVEAAASCAGTITPPVMGAVIFLLVKLVGVPYLKLVIIAAVPAFIYYVSIFIGIDREAIICNFKRLPNGKSPKLFSVIIQGIPFLIPLVYLVYRIFRGIPPTMCAFEATILIVICTIIKNIITKNKDNISVGTYIKAIEDAVKGTVAVAIACTLAGTIVANIYLTGVGIKFSSVLMYLAHGYLFPTIFLSALLAVIFGMGIPTSASYVLAVSLAGPALVASGIPILHAHFFIAWYAGLATITPPVCISSYMAAGIAKVDNPLKTGWIAVFLASGGFIVPFLFIYRPELLLTGTTIDTLKTVFVVIIGIFAISTVLFGNFLYYKYKFYETIIVIISAFMLFWPSYIINILGLLTFGLVLLKQYYKKRKE